MRVRLAATKDRLGLGRERLVRVLRVGKKNVFVASQTICGLVIRLDRARKCSRPFLRLARQTDAAGISMCMMSGTGITQQQQQTA